MQNSYLFRLRRRHADTRQSSPAAAFLQLAFKHARLNQCLAEIPQSVRIRDRGVQIKTVEAQPGYPITRHRLRRVERQPTEALRRQHLELQNRVQRHSREFGRKSAKSTVAAVCADRSPFGAISVEVPLKFPKAKLFRHPDLRFFQPLRIVPSDKKHRVFEGANRVGQQQTAMLRSAEPRSVNIGIRPRKFWITQCQGVLRGLPHCKVCERVFDLNPDFVGPRDRQAEACQFSRNHNLCHPARFPAHIVVDEREKYVYNRCVLAVAYFWRRSVCS